MTDPVEFEDSVPFSIEDEKFDLIYPAKIRRLSPIFWTPVAVAAEAVKWLVSAPGQRVLDIGCGPGKFCLVAASLADGQFTGVEQRIDLVTAARQAAIELGIPPADDADRDSKDRKTSPSHSLHPRNPRLIPGLSHVSGVEFIHDNIVEVDFAAYDAFYLFNPFEENIFQGNKIDRTVPLSPELFRKYTSHVSAQLGARPIGTRVATYMGYANDIPSCYSCVSTRFGDDLKLWTKEREYDADLESFKVSRSYHGSSGWRAPRA
ncbi:MAG: methyltransferase domain-containing protein [Chthoniobacterales bacterium]